MTEVSPKPRDSSPSRHSQIALVLAVVGAAVVAALAFLAVRDAPYEATADVLVAPIAEDDPAFVGVPLIRPSSDGTRPVQTGAALLNSPEIPGAVARALGGGWSRADVASSVGVAPRGGSDLVAVSASADTAEEAARIANTYVEEALEIRRRSLAPQLRRLILRTREQLESTSPDDETRFQLDDRLKRLRSAAQRGDPTLAQVSRAQPPTAPAAAAAWLVLAVALLVGLLLGVAAAALRRSD